MSKANHESEHSPIEKSEVCPEVIVEQTGRGKRVFRRTKVYNKDEYKMVDQQILRWRKKRLETARKKRAEEKKRKEAEKAKRRMWNIFNPEEE